MADNTPPGGFRVLWVGDPTILPADPKLAGDTGFATTRNGSGDARALVGRAGDECRRSGRRAPSTAATSGSTSRLGHLLAPAGVRYIAFISRAAPHERCRRRARTRGSPTRWPANSISRCRASTTSGVVYQNDAWIPAHALVPPNDKNVHVDGRDPRSSALRSDATGVAGVQGSSGNLAVPDPDAAVVGSGEPGLARVEQRPCAPAHRRVRLDERVRRSSAHGNGFACRITTSGSSRLLLVFEVLAWIAAIVAWFLTRRSANGAHERA